MSRSASEHEKWEQEQLLMSTSKILLQAVIEHNQIPLERNSTLRTSPLERFLAGLLVRGYRACSSWISSWYASTEPQPAEGQPVEGQPNESVAAEPSVPSAPILSVYEQALHDLDRSKDVEHDALQTPNQSACAVCLERCVRTANYPCGHLALCMSCALTLCDEGRMVQPLCPICSQPIQRFIRVYPT